MTGSFFDYILLFIQIYAPIIKMSSIFLFIYVIYCLLLFFPVYKPDSNDPKTGFMTKIAAYTDKQFPESTQYTLHKRSIRAKFGRFGLLPAKCR
jgi:hypothetical protein